MIPETEPFSLEFILLDL